MGNQNHPVNAAPRRVSFGASNNQGYYENNGIVTTKYTWWNFIPKGIYLQFLKPANIFYLFVAILQCIPVISALHPVASVAPFIIVIAVSLIKEAYEDNKRRKNDRITNDETFTWRLQQGQYVRITWREVMVGDFVMVLKNQLIPADLLMLFSPEENGVSFVETANLDGQRNLKSKKVPQPNNITKYYQHFEQMRGWVECGPPNKDLNDFNGRMTVEGRAPQAVDETNLLLRGTILKNTHFVVGLVVYAGMQTKIVLNSTGVRHKVSSVEKKVNRIQLVLFALLFILVLIACVVHYLQWTRFGSRSNIFYLRNKYNWSIVGDSALLSFTVFLLLAFLIPISMNISMEVLKTLQGNLISQDIEMSYTVEKQRIYSRVVNTSIIQELGTVDYVMTDKTGTLTSNCMEFKNAWIQGTQYTAEHMRNEKSKLMRDNYFSRFWTSVVLNHDCIVDTETSTYQGSSADEVCFLEQATFLGFVFRNKSANSIQIEVFGQKKIYEMKIFLPFSQRKMSSVVLKDIDSGMYVVLSKGADTSVLAAASSNEPPNKLSSMKYSLDKFSRNGLRTLAYGMRTLNNQEYNQIKQEYEAFIQQKGSGTMDKAQQKQKLNAIAKKIESNLTMIGVTAIQDKLQDGVPETIKRLQEAGIKVVMITGDKLETAENIGFLSNFISSQFKIYRLKDGSQNIVAEIQKIGHDLTQQQEGQAQPVCILIEGNAIQKIMSNPDKVFIEQLGYIFMRAQSLIFCRSTPSEKGQIVKFFKKTFHKTVLAIGDGGNDVNMIQEADIGVGLIGKEGNQAANASDFSFAQFRFLQRLLNHHGRWAYYRISYFFVYYAFKNFILTFLLFFYLGYCGWSGTNILSSSYLTVYNSVISVFLTIYYGVLEQDINSDMYPPAYATLPKIFMDYKRRQLFSYTRYLIWSICSVITAAWIFFVTIYALGGINDPAGYVTDMRGLSTSLSLSTFLIITVIVYLDMYNFTAVSWFILLIMSLLVALIYFIVENFANIGPNYYGWSDHFTWRYWLVMWIVVMGFVIARVAYNTFKFNLFPSMIHKQMILRNRNYDALRMGHVKTDTVISYGIPMAGVQPTENRLHMDSHEGQFMMQPFRMENQEGPIMGQPYKQTHTPQQNVSWTPSLYPGGPQAMMTNGQFYTTQPAFNYTYR